MTKNECEVIIAAFQRERKIGDLTIILPEPPKYKEIANWEHPKAWQKFYYDPEIPKKGEEPSDDFIEKEFTIFKEGYWFFNNGNLEYITGYHYIFLNYWTDRGKKLIFIDAQRDVFYWWDAIEKDDNIGFGNLTTNRRFGKSVLALFIAYIRSATRKFQYAGIQSKTNTDGKGLFNKLIASWTKLPDWWKPTDTGETRPASVLEFFESRKRSSKEKKVYGESLDSKIDYKPSSEVAYDGEELDTYIADEIGKTLDCNVKERHDVVMRCLMKASTIKGKGLNTTTVEEMEKKGGKNFKLIWDGAKAKEINPKTGRNPSLATNLFISADYGYYGQHPVTGEWFVDEFGYSKRDIAKQYILDSWEGLEGDALASAQRKDPLTEKHIWQLKNFGGEFDNDLLEFQKDFLEGTNDDPKDNAPKNLIRRVTFYEEGEVVKWRDDPKGHCQMVWDFADSKKESNKRIKGSNGLWSPGNKEFGDAGVDPVRKNNAIGKEKSTSVLYVYRKHDANDPENSGMMILRFAPLQRMKFNADFHRYVILIIRYYGIEVNYESEVDEYIGWFKEEGMQNYAMDRPLASIAPGRKRKPNEKGTPASDPFSRQVQWTLVDDYIKLYYYKIYFIEVILSLIDYDSDNRTPFDDAVAFMQALIGGVTRKAKQEVKASTMQILPTVKRTYSGLTGTY